MTKIGRHGMSNREEETIVNFKHTAAAIILTGIVCAGLIVLTVNSHQCVNGKGECFWIVGQALSACK